jgi:hypothetical protein
MPRDSNTYVWGIEVINSVGSVFSYDYVIRDSPLGSGMALTVDGSNIVNSTGQPVFFRGIGIACGGTPEYPDAIFFTSSGTDTWNDQWNFSGNPTNGVENATEEQQAITQTFSTWQRTWDVNSMRIFICSNWVSGTFTPAAINPSNYGSDHTQYNLITSLQGLATVAAHYGIYIDVCMSGIDGYNDGNPSNETTAYWNTVWTNLANGLKNYPNVIFEAWNEPTEYSTSNTIMSSQFLSYVETMYGAVRATGATNLIFIQWEPGSVPSYSWNIAWAGQVASALNDPNNVVYTTHLYYYSPGDETNFWDQGGKDNNAGGVPMTAAQLETQLASLVGTMGVTAPLVFNEQGDCLGVSANVTSDYVWWSNLLQAETALNLGGVAYYWISAVHINMEGEDLLSGSGYTPSTMGQEYINAYQVSP